MQVASNNPGNGVGCKPPPPNKLPPPPPPPPPPISKPPPPPPPRNSSQLSFQNVNVVVGGQLGQGCGQVSAGIQQNVNGMTVLNGGSSVGSINSAGRCGHSQATVPSGGSNPSQYCQRNSMMKSNYDNCSSRSSVSSHNSSLQHHHHVNTNHPLANSANTITNFSNVCSHQAVTNNGCPCQPTPSQHSHIDSSSMSDNGSSRTYGIDNRVGLGSSNCSGCCGNNNVHHVRNLTPKCHAQSQAALNMAANIRGNNVIGGQTTTTISRNTLFQHNENTNPNLLMGANESRVHCQGSCGHHHQHHGLHENQVAPNPVIQPVDGLSNSFHRCHAAQSNTISSLPSLMNDQLQRPSINGHCNHGHRPNICNHHHHATNFCDHHAPYPTNQQQTPHQFNGCSCPHHGRASPNVTMGKTFTASCNSIRHCPQSSALANRSSDISNTDSLLSTTHTHNLSNSSTTTHTSNMAVKHQPQSLVHLPMSRGNRSNSSQHYDQYGQSSAASTSSATASLSNYQIQSGSEDRIPLYPSSKIHQPLPLPPTRMFNNNNNHVPNNSGNANNMNYNSNMSHPANSHHIPVMTSTLINTSQGVQSMHPLPPLPPKPNSPNTSSCSTQITTVTSSPSLSSLPITRVTSQAGVQNPLPESDTPPPLPPLNHSSRAQLSTNLVQLPPPFIKDQHLINLSPDGNGVGQMTEEERKTQRQVEMDIERRKQMGEPHGICFKCGEKVMPAQEACKAMNKIYHVNCFVCYECNRTLLGQTFYPVLDRVYCEEDFKFTGHLQSLAKCAACSQPIVDMILTPPAMGKSFHPKCFKCCVCGQCLDGVPFTIDNKDKIYCVKDYHTIYSPKCAACGKSITPADETGETIRVVSMEKDYHIDCFRCEDCGLQLTDEEPSQSYPLDNHLLCQGCHLNRKYVGLELA